VFRLSIPEASRVLVFFIMVCPAVVLAAVGAVGSGSDLNANAYFVDGIKAFRSGDYHEAQIHFEKARSAGLDSVALDYNQGVSYYKLGRYPLAGRAFQRVTRDKAMAPLAYYNLGRVYVRLKDPEQARYWLLKAGAANNAKLKALADIQLKRISRESNNKNWTLYTILGLGHDDNLLDPAQGFSIKKDSSYTEALLNVRALFSGVADEGIFMGASAYSIRFQDQDFYNYNLLQADLAKTMKFGVWLSEFTLVLDQSTLSGQSYQRTVALGIKGRRKMRAGVSLDLRYQFKTIDSLNPGYDYLQGTQHLFKAGMVWALQPGRLRLNYILESNDRDDYSNGIIFTSHSPLRHTIDVTSTSVFDDGWQARVKIAYRVSEYADASLFTGVTGTRIKRSDDRTQAILGVSRNINTRWRLNAEYRNTDNSSNIDVFDYTQNLYVLEASGIF